MPKRGVRKKYFNCKIHLKLQQLSSPTGVSKNIKDKKTQTWKEEGRHKQRGTGLKQPRNENVCNKPSFVCVVFLNGKKRRKQSPSTTKQGKKTQVALYFFKRKGWE